MKRLLLIIFALVLLASCAPSHGSWGHGWQGGWNWAGSSRHAPPVCGVPAW